jgi:hypothetical protein
MSNPTQPAFRLDELVRAGVVADYAREWRESSKQTCLQPDSGVYSIETTEARCRPCRVQSEELRAGFISVTRSGSGAAARLSVYDQLARPL